jgi:hypothetical protein
MKKFTSAVTLGIVLGLASVGAHATLVNGSVLNIGAGSYFGMQLTVFTTTRTTITGHNGLILGTTQLASGSHSGLPNGTESPGIDSPWIFATNTGMHQTVSPTNILSATGNTATIDFSGWAWTWIGLPSINMGGGAWGTNPSGVANITCGVDCGNGDTYNLYYTATVPHGDPTGFGDIHYGLSLTGTISTVPVPAAVWLLGSGLVGLVGVARRRKQYFWGQSKN